MFHRNIYPVSSERDQVGRTDEPFPTYYDYTRQKMFKYEWTITNLQKMSFIKNFKGPSLYIDCEKNVAFRISLSKEYPQHFYKRIFVDINLTSNSLLSNTITEIIVHTTGKDERENLLFVSEFKGTGSLFKNLKFTKPMDSVKLRKNAKLTIQSRITVVYKNMCFEKEETSIHIRKLSHDLKYLMCDGERASDVKIEVDRAKYYMHRFVLCTRCPVFKELFESCKLNGSSFQKVWNSDIRLTRYENMDYVFFETEEAVNVEAALAYMYYGYPPYLKASCCYSFYKFAEKMKLEELVSYLKPSELHCMTNVEVKTITEYFPVKNFKSVLYQQSPIFRAAVDENIEWQMEVKFEPGHQKGYVTLHKVVASKGFVPTEFKLSIKQLDGSFRVIGNYKYLFPCYGRCKIQTKPSSILGGKRLYFEYPCKGDDELEFTIDESVVANDSLIIVCELTVCTGESSSLIRMSPVNYKPLSLKSLANSFRNAICSEFTDMSISLGYDNFQIHKAMIVTRMRDGEIRDFYFSKFHKLKSMKISERINGRDFLRYVYAGDIDNIEAANAEEHFAVASLFDFKELQQHCAQILIKSINNVNVLNLLKFAEEKSIPELRNAALNLIEHREFYSDSFDRAKILKALNST